MHNALLKLASLIARDRVSLLLLAAIVGAAAMLAGCPRRYGLIPSLPAPTGCVARTYSCRIDLPSQDATRAAAEGEGGAASPYWCTDAHRWTRLGDLTCGEVGGRCVVGRTAHCEAADDPPAGDAGAPDAGGADAR